MILTVIALMFAAFFQNVAFTLVSRARNRNNNTYHVIAAICSNAVWFMTFRILVKTEMDWMMFIPYTVATVSGSLFGGKVSMFIEQLIGATCDGHVKPPITVIPNKPG
jgi:hypothetical protein